VNIKNWVEGVLGEDGVCHGSKVGQDAGGDHGEGIREGTEIESISVLGHRRRARHGGLLLNGGLLIGVRREGCEWCGSGERWDRGRGRGIRIVGHC
jgi:hypothetical protein